MRSNRATFLMQFMKKNYNYKANNLVSMVDYLHSSVVHGEMVGGGYIYISTACIGSSPLSGCPPPRGP